MRPFTSLPVVIPLTLGLSACGESMDGGTPRSETRATTDTNAPGSTAPTEARWTTSGVVAALEATTTGRADLAAFTTPAGRTCQAFPPLGTGERTESGYTLDDYENAPDLEGRPTGTVVSGRQMERLALVFRGQACSDPFPDIPGGVPLRIDLVFPDHGLAVEPGE